MFALVDCNSCYASCHQIFRPDLRGQPVVVLSNNDGCIVALSKEAKALGIGDLQAFFKVEKQLKQQQVHIFSSNYVLYGDISQRVMATLKRFAAEVEVYSIDEMFLALDALPVDLKAYGQTIRQVVWKEVRMPVCVGIAPTKTLAKLVNHAAKKIPQTQGVCLLDRPEKWQWLLKRVAVNKVWGVGHRLGKRLNAININTAYELARADAKQIRRMFGVTLERTLSELNGLPAIALEEQPAPKQQIVCSRSFGDKPETLAPLQMAVSGYAARAAEKLRAQRYVASAVQVFINTSPYEPGYYSNSRTAQLPYPTDDTRLIVLVAKQLVAALFKPDKRYLKAGVGLLGLGDKAYRQADLFHPEQSLKAEKLMTVLDSVNRRYGRGAVYLAAEGNQSRWKMRQNYPSPAYTSRWSDIPVVRC